MLVPFTGGFEHGIYLDLGYVFIPFVFFVVLGTDNGVNFTDGLDGLCTSVTILVATFLTIISIGENSGISPITGAAVSYTHLDVYKRQDRLYPGAGCDHR